MNRIFRSLWNASLGTFVAGPGRPRCGLPQRGRTKVRTSSPDWP
ncbi:MAG: hypothetical protein EOP72_05565 [Variovorax sp.]|nr:MAG: hypothetical protein EOP72_05565 [Variovorax sp.]